MTAQALRARQTELTRDLILEALVDLVVERPLADFSLQDVADRAGVALRTVYRHFASREALLEALLPWVSQQISMTGGFQFPATADDIADQVTAKFIALEKYARLFLAQARVESLVQGNAAASALSLMSVRSALAEVTGHLDPDMAEAVVWTIRQICGVRTLLVLHEEGGIAGAHAGAAAAWATRLLIKALREGSSPQLAEEEER